MNHHTIVRVLSLAVSFAAISAAVLADPDRTDRRPVVTPLFGFAQPADGPFPSDRFTVVDPDQLTGRRVALPLPDCGNFPSDCDEIRVINELDGFNLQPRLSIPFSGAIDPGSANGSSIILVCLGDVVTGAGAGEVVGINEVVWDPPSNVLHAESDQLLRQHARYALIVTDRVRDSGGDPVEAGAFASFRRDLNYGQLHDPEIKAYRKALLDAVAASGLPPVNVVAASVFTTQSATALLEKIRDQIKAATPPRADFDIARDSDGKAARAVFDLADIPVSPSVPKDSGIQWFAQTKADPSAPLTPMSVPREEGLGTAPGAVARIAFARYRSWDYEAPEAYEAPQRCDPGIPRLKKFIPRVPTASGVPQSCETDLLFDLFLPSADRKPAGGWPVAIYVHGTGASKETAIFAVARTMAAQGIATIGITNAAHGFGSGGLLKVTTTKGVFTLTSGGRGIDQDGDGKIDSTEGLFAAPPLQLIVNRRDAGVQTAVDLLALVRTIEIGVDVDGDGIADLDASRIYYFGNSMGGQVGPLLLATDPDVRAGGINGIIDTHVHAGRLGQDRNVVSTLLSQRNPSPLNALPVAAPGFGFDENMPGRDEPVRINDVTGAMALQEIFERMEWVGGTGDAQSFAPHIRKAPLDGMPVKDVIVHMMKGDRVVPNPTTSVLVRAGDLKDRVTYYRYDLVFPTLDAAELAALGESSPALLTRAKNPHFLLSNLTNPPPDRCPKSAAITFSHRDMAVNQLAVFFASDGEVTIDPDGDGPFFETPIQGALPETTNFIP